MKFCILCVYFGTVLTYDGNLPKKNFFVPHPYYRSELAMSEGTDPLRSNRGVFFEPATLMPGFGFDNMHEQVLNYEARREKREEQREKRDAAGALRIVTNHAQPIHADVKSDGTTADVTEKPCPKSKYPPSHVESGVVFQVTAPEDAFFELKSLRKSWPLPNKLELVRSINRVVTLAVLLISAVVEFYPLLKSLFSIVYSFIYL